MKRGCVVIAATMLIFSAASADDTTAATTTDAAATIATLLKAKGNVPWTHTIMIWEVCRESHEGKDPILVPCQVPKTVTDSVALTASAIKIVSRNELQYDPSIKTDIPDQVSTSTTTWINCSATQTFTDNETLSIAFQRSSSVSISHTVSHAQSEGFNIGINIGIVKLGGNIGVTDTETTGTIDTSSYQQTVTRQKSISTPTPPLKAFAAVIETWPVSYKINFHTTATVDGDLNSNDKYHKLSDVLSESERTFTINGTIGFVDAAEGTVLSYDNPVRSKAMPERHRNYSRSNGDVLRYRPKQNAKA